MSASLTKESIEQFIQIVAETSESIIKEESQRLVLDPLIIRTLRMVERHIEKRKLVVYGGTALNAVMPPADQFYDYEIDLPDWDFFSDKPIEDAIKIADDVHEKTGMETFVTTAAHHGTYKVYADGNAIADITYVNSQVLDVLRKHALKRDDILYSGPDYLRMSAYLELSRPRGQVERWEKVFKRLLLLNKNHPIQIRQHNPEEPSLSFKTRNAILHSLASLQKDLDKIGNGSFAFFGPEALHLIKKSVDVDSNAPELKMSLKGSFPMLLSSDPADTVEECIRALSKVDELNTEFDQHSTAESDGEKDDASESDGHVELYAEEFDGVGEFLPKYYEIKESRTNNTLCLVIGTSNGCQSIYRLPTKKHGTLNVASIESCLYIYFAMRFAEILPIPASNILKTCDKLVRLHYKAFSNNKKPVIPVPTLCIGKQETFKDMRSEKIKMIKEISETSGRRSADYYLWNIRYNGGDDDERKTIMKALEKHHKKEDTMSADRFTSTKIISQTKKRTRKYKPRSQTMKRRG